METTKEKHATHTPGPWHYTLADETSAGGVYGNEKSVCDIIPKELQVAYDCEEVEIANANARLIAAAPEMFEVLSEVLIEYEAEAKAEGWDLPTTGEMIREVLAKVEGGEG
jgi:hypothetical protein